MELLQNLRYEDITLLGLTFHIRWIMFPALILILSTTAHFLCKYFAFPKKYYRKGRIYNPDIPRDVAENHYKMWDWILAAAKSRSSWRITGLKSEYLYKVINSPRIPYDCFLCNNYCAGDCHSCPLKDSSTLYLNCNFYFDIIDNCKTKRNLSRIRKIRDCVLC